MLTPLKKSYDKPRQHIKKQRYHFANNGLYSQAMVFPVVMNGCNSSTIKKAEHRRTDAFKLWSRRKILRFPWIARRSNQEILKEINPEYSLDYWGFPGGSMIKNFFCQFRRGKRHGFDPTGLRRFPREGNGNSLQYSFLENPMDREAWQAWSPWGPWGP